MKIILRFTSLFLILFITIIVFVNISSSITLETNFLSLKANVGFLILLCTVLGSISILLLIFSFGISKDKKLKKQLENQKLEHEIESDKVKQLEAKIKTLEEALKIATKN